MSQGFGDISCTLPKNGHHAPGFQAGVPHSAAALLRIAVGFVRRWRIDANGDDRNVVGSTTGISSCIMVASQRCRMSIEKTCYVFTYSSNFLAPIYVFTKWSPLQLSILEFHRSVRNHLWFMKSASTLIEHDLKVLVTFCDWNIVFT